MKQNCRLSSQISIQITTIVARASLGDDNTMIVLSLPDEVLVERTNCCNPINNNNIYL